MQLRNAWEIESNGEFQKHIYKTIKETIHTFTSEVKKKKWIKARNMEDSRIIDIKMTARENCHLNGWGPLSGLRNLQRIWRAVQNVLTIVRLLQPDTIIRQLQRADEKDYIFACSEALRSRKTFERTCKLQIRLKSLIRCSLMNPLLSAFKYYCV